MAKPNYNFAKRHRDLAKEQKKEEKLQRKKAAAEEGTVELNPDADTAVDAEGEVVAENTETPAEKAPDA